MKSRHLTKQSAETLGVGLRDYFIPNLCFDIGEGTDMKQQLKLKGEHLHFQVQADELVSVLFLLKNDMLHQVKEVFI